MTERDKDSSNVSVDVAIGAGSTLVRPFVEPEEPLSEAEIQRAILDVLWFCDEK